MILNQADNIMLGSREVQKVYLGRVLVWERKKNTTKIALIRLDENAQETSYVQYFDDLSDVSAALNADSTNFYKVIIGDDSAVEILKENIFKGKTNLYAVVLGKSVTQIERNAFENCTGLHSAVMSDSVNFLGDRWIFGRCTALEEVVLSGNIPTLVLSMFNGCTALREITIPDGVRTIANYAFYNCTSLTSITIPESMETISTQYPVFGLCSALKEIIIRKPEGSISGAPWGAPNAQVIWTG